MDILAVAVRFETEVSVSDLLVAEFDLLVAEFSPKPIATAASPAVTHMTARRIEASLPVRIKVGMPNFRGPNREGCVSYFTHRSIIIDGNNKGALYPCRGECVWIASDAQTIFRRRLHQPRRPRSQDWLQEWT
jgi:hypothetical protein